MLNCQQVTRLLSESQERTLTLQERISLKMHGMMCSGCRNFESRCIRYVRWRALSPNEKMSAPTNDYRRLAMKGIVGQIQPAFNMDDVHRGALDQVLSRHGLDAYTAQDR